MLEIRLDVTQFDQWVKSQTDGRYELINGRTVEVVSNSPASRIAFKIGGFLFLYLQEHPIGEATGADGGYQIGSERYIPDVGFIRHERRVREEGGGYYPIAPDLAVEVISNPHNMQEMRVKIGHYVAAKTLVWVIDLEAQTIEVYQPGQPTQVLHHNDTLTGGDVLPGFTLPISAIFLEVH